MKKILVLLMVLSLFCASALAEDTLPFRIRNGDENSPRIAITMDDCYEIDKVDAARELCLQYGIHMTFFPMGMNILPEDGDVWRGLVDAGCEIGSHTFGHLAMDTMDTKAMISSICRTQQALDAALGYHYQIRWLRPPFGNISDENGNLSSKVVSCLKRTGYNHVVMWNVSQAADQEKCVTQTKNGCIMLFHARNKDINTLKYVIPILLEKGFEMVTVSELLGLEPTETGEELYVYNWDDYKQ